MKIQFIKSNFYQPISVRKKMPKTNGSYLTNLLTYLPPLDVYN